VKEYKVAKTECEKICSQNYTRVKRSAGFQVQCMAVNGEEKPYMGLLGICFECRCFPLMDLSKTMDIMTWCI